jgi:hypothetical protein
VQGDHRQRETAIARRFTASDRNGRRATHWSTELLAAFWLLIAAAALLLGATSARAADPVIAAAGDIACNSDSSAFNGGNGTSTECR